MTKRTSSSAQEKPEDTQLFRFNTKLRERHYHRDLKFPNCPYRKDFNGKNIRASFESWIESLYRREDLYW